jgi:hypothetical protein
MQTASAGATLPQCQQAATTLLGASAGRFCWAQPRADQIKALLLHCTSRELADFVAKVPKRRVTNFPQEDETGRDRRLM